MGDLPYRIDNDWKYARNQIEDLLRTIYENPILTLTSGVLQGDILYASALNSITNLAKGSPNTKLFTNNAGTAPEWSSGYKIGTFTRAMDSATGDISYTGVGFKPSTIIFLCLYEAYSLSIGPSDATNDYCLYVYDTGPSYSGGACSIIAVEAAGKFQLATVKTNDADGFTLSWTRTGATASGTAYIYYLALR